MSDTRIDDGIEGINNAVIKHVLNFLKTGDFKNKTANSYMKAYSAVHRLADDEQDSSEKLFNYYKKTISDYMDDALNSMKDEEDEKLVDMFLKEYSQCRILIHWMRKVFTYLDKFFTKNSNCGSLCANALKLCFNHLFLPIKEKLFYSVNGLIETHRNCQPVETSKIKNMLRIFEEVDMKNPELNKAGESLYWTEDCNYGVLNEWFKKYFIQATEAYSIKKAQKEITSFSAPEYVRSALKFLDEEFERQGDYIHKNFHETINAANFKNLIDSNAREIGKVRNLLILDGHRSEIYV